MSTAARHVRANGSDRLFARRGPRGRRAGAAGRPAAGAGGPGQVLRAAEVRVRRADGGRPPAPVQRPRADGDHGARVRRWPADGEHRVLQAGRRGAGLHVRREYAAVVTHICGGRGEGGWNDSVVRPERCC